MEKETVPKAESSEAIQPNVGPETQAETAQTQPQVNEAQPEPVKPEEEQAQAQAPEAPEAPEAPPQAPETAPREPEKASEGPNEAQEHAPEPLKEAQPSPKQEPEEPQTQPAEEPQVQPAEEPKAQPETGEAPTPEPLVKKRRIDSSDVLESVAHFPEFVSSVVVYDPAVTPVYPDKLNSIVWVRIARRYLTRSNEALAQRKLWGTDVYTDDSDVVAALYHNGLVEDGEDDLVASIKLLPRLKKYQGSFSNDLNSRTWAAHHDGNSFKVMGVKPMPGGSAENPVSERLERVRRWEVQAARQTSLADLLAAVENN